jgi:hypothetical protein
LGSAPMSSLLSSLRLTHTRPRLDVRGDPTGTCSADMALLHRRDTVSHAIFEGPGSLREHEGATNRARAYGATRSSDTALTCENTDAGPLGTGVFSSRVYRMSTERRTTRPRPRRKRRSSAARTRSEARRARTPPSPATQSARLPPPSTAGTTTVPRPTGLRAGARRRRRRLLSHQSCRHDAGSRETVLVGAPLPVSPGDTA